MSGFATVPSAVVRTVTVTVMGLVVVPTAKGAFSVQLTPDVAGPQFQPVPVTAVGWVPKLVGRASVTMTVPTVAPAPLPLPVAPVFVTVML